MTIEPHTGFRDPTSLTRTTKGFLYASIPLVLLSIANSWRDFRWLSNTGEPAPPLEGPLVALAVLAYRPWLSRWAPQSRR